jgi:uncharacterized protein (DUF362 family)
MQLTRRELAVGLAAWPAEATKRPHAGTVAVARCASYGEELVGALEKMFDSLGGLGRVVKNKTVTVKLNLTGSPALRFQGKAPARTHYSHPRMVMAMAHLLEEAGARRIRLAESCAATAGPLEEYMLDSGWNVRQLQNAARGVEFENTNARGSSKSYARVRVPGGGQVFPGYELNKSWVDTDVVLSMAKLKDHATCGVTLSMKNMFGITPASIYGDDAGFDEPNENPTKGRLKVCHFGERQPSRVAPQENDKNSSREPGYRMPRITVELCAARPVDIALIDGVETVTGGEGPWIKGLTAVKPGVVIAGFNPVNTDAVGTAVMGYDPLAPRGSAPFENCDNTLLLAHRLGLGSADLRRIEVIGESVASVRFPFRR